MFERAIRSRLAKGGGKKKRREKERKGKGEGEKGGKRGGNPF